MLKVDDLTNFRVAPLVARPEDEPDQPLCWFWRAECWVHSYDHGYHARVGFNRFRIVKRTPRGVWLRPEWSWIKGDLTKPGRKFGDKFVLLGAHRAYAYPTRAEALASLKIRTRWRVIHATATYERAKCAEAFMKEHFA